MLYARYLAGTGNLAAVPGTSMHEKGLAIDHAPSWWGMDAEGANRFGLHHPVPGEPWHVEPMARGGFWMGKYDKGGWLEVHSELRLNEKVLARETSRALEDRRMTYQ